MSEAALKIDIGMNRPELPFQLVGDEAVDAGGWYVIRGKDGSDVAAQFEGGDAPPLAKVYISGPYACHQDAFRCIGKRAKRRQKRRNLVAFLALGPGLFVLAYLALQGMPL